MPENWEQYINESTKRLTEIIRNDSSDNRSEIAKDAFRCLCFRFQAEIISNTRTVCRKWGYDNDIADEIAYNALDRFWKYPKFDSSKCKINDIDKCFVFYIHKICRRLLINHKSNQQNMVEAVEELEIVFELPKISDSSELKKGAELIEVSRKIDEILNKLGPKHKAIYLTYKSYEQEGRKLPRTLLQKLRLSLNISQNTIRFYKKEATEAVQKILNEYGK